MDASSSDSSMSIDADASQVDCGIHNTENHIESCVDLADSHSGATHTDQSETEFKSPNQLLVPVSQSTSKRKINTANQTQKSVKPTENKKDESKNKKSEEPVQQVPIPYTEPEWGDKCQEEYYFDVLKNGIIIDTVTLTDKSFYVFGRLPSCDITLEHPSLSRYHAVVQYSVGSTHPHEKGWYLYDLDSTHGTWVNKKKVTPKVYNRLRVGHIVKFGGSSRLHILQGPVDDTEDESEMTVTELKEQRERLQKEAELFRQMGEQEELQRQEAQKKLLEDRGCGWGMDEDAEENEGENPFASLIAENENLYIDDPKKALKGFYEREGCDLPDYQFTEESMGKHKCRLELPVDGPNGEELVAEAVVSGKRKDAVVACALEACRILDRLGMLRSSSHESRKRKQRKWEDDDFYDSDEDTFLDRTGTIEKKRSIRMKNAGKSEPETYESLLEKYNAVASQIQDIESKLERAKAEAESRASDEMDELDAYMVSIKAGAMDTKTRIRLKGDLLRLKAEEQKLRKLVNIARPASLPPLKPTMTVISSSPSPAADCLSRKLLAQQKQQKKQHPASRTQAPVQTKPDDYEEQEEEDEDSADVNLNQPGEKKQPTDDQKKYVKLQSSREPHGGPLSLSTKDVDNSRTLETIKSGVIMKGPLLPPALAKDECHEKKSRSSYKQSTAEVLNALEKKQAKQGKVTKDPNFESSAPDYAMWLPPAEQSGDGRTSLNDKLGY